MGLLLEGSSSCGDSSLLASSSASSISSCGACVRKGRTIAKAITLFFREVHVPLNPEEIVPEGAFAGVPRLRHVSVESGIRLIGAEAWQNCRQLRIVKLPATVVGIADNAFRDCKLLNSVLAPGCRDFGYKAFAECCSLQWVYASEGVANMFTSEAKFGQYLFQGCINLAELTLSELPSPRGSTLQARTSEPAPGCLSATGILRVAMARTGWHLLSPRLMLTKVPGGVLSDYYHNGYPLTPKMADRPYNQYGTQFYTKERWDQLCVWLTGNPNFRLQLLDHKQALRDHMGFSQEATDPGNKAHRTVPRQNREAPRRQRGLPGTVGPPHRPRPMGGPMVGGSKVVGSRTHPDQQTSSSCLILSRRWVALATLLLVA